MSALDGLVAPRVAHPRAAWAARLGGLVLAAACAFVAVRRVDVPAVAASLRGAHPAFLAAAALANLASLAAHAGRWRALVRAPGVRVRWRDAFAALAAGFAAGIALPARGGDLVRSHLLARRAGVSTWSVLVASWLDYVVGAVALVLLIGALAAAAPMPGWAASGLGILAALTALAAAAAWLLRPRSGPRAIHAAPGFVVRLRAGLAAVREPRALLAALGWAVAGWAAEWAIALAALAALGLPATPTTAALAVVAASLVAALPLAPGNAGSFELATALVAGGGGAERHAALAFAVAFHLVHLVPVAMIGGAVLVRSAAVRDAG